MALLYEAVILNSGANLLHGVRAEDSRSGLLTLEHDGVHEHLAAISADDPDRRDLPRDFVDIEIRRAAKIDAGVRQIDGPFGVMRKAREKLFAGGDDLVGLSTKLRNLAGQLDILVVAVHAAEGVTRQRAGLRVAPSHEDPGVDAAGQRDARLLVSVEVARQALDQGIFQE